MHGKVGSCYPNITTPGHCSFQNIDAYAAQGIDIWGITVENEPLGNGENWESMHYTAEEMNEFVKNHLGPQLEKPIRKLCFLVTIKTVITWKNGWM